MKFLKRSNERLDLLGDHQHSTALGLTEIAAKVLQSKTGYLSVLAGVSVVALGQPQDALGKDKETTAKIPPRIAQRASEIVAELNQKCSTPELLRRQYSFRLPGQPWEANLVEMLVGGDNCPGTTVPGGVYTVGSPFTDTGSTTGANNTVSSVQAGCSDYTTNAGPDHIYAFKITARGPSASIQMTTTTGTYDSSIYILNGTTGAMCPAGTSNAVTNCLQGADAGLAGAGETLSTAEINTLPLNTQLYLFIDSFYSTVAGNGNYTIKFVDMTIAGAAPTAKPPMDFNGDGKTDYAVARNVGPGGSGTTAQIRWLISQNGSGAVTGFDWGDATTDFITPADFDGDSKTDIAVWRPGAATTAAFYILQSGTNTLRTELFGQTGDDPAIIGDYDGDGKADPAVYRCPAIAAPAGQCLFYYRGSNANPGGNVTFVPWGFGNDGSFFPNPGDFDGDGKYDFCIQRADPSSPSNGQFVLLKSAGGTEYINWGLASDFIIPGDYDGDGKSDLMVRRTVGGARQHYLLTRTGATSQTTWGITGDSSVPGDYDGDGKTDIAIWRGSATPATSAFWVLNSSNAAVQQTQWGQCPTVSTCDFAVAGAYVH